MAIFHCYVSLPEGIPIHWHGHTHTMLKPHIAYIHHHPKGSVYPMINPIGMLVILGLSHKKKHSKWDNIPKYCKSYCGNLQLHSMCINPKKDTI